MINLSFLYAETLVERLISLAQELVCIKSKFHSAQSFKASQFTYSCGASSCIYFVKSRYGPVNSILFLSHNSLSFPCSCLVVSLALLDSSPLSHFLLDRYMYPWPLDWCVYLFTQITLLSSYFFLLTLTSSRNFFGLSLFIYKQTEDMHKL